MRFTAALDALIAEHRSDPLLLYWYIRTEFTYLPYQGSMKDSDGVLLTQSGSDIDLASLLIAAYRRLGIPSCYAQGQIVLSERKATEWLGVDDIQAAYVILNNAGAHPSYEWVNGENWVRFDHTWVEAYMNWSNYRGIPNAPGGRSWVPFDPSFRTLESNGRPELYSASGINASTIVLNFESTFRPRTAAEEYLDAIYAYAAATFPALAPYNALWRLRPIPEEFHRAPGSLPYTVISILNAAGEIDDGDRHKIRIRTNGLTYLTPVAAISGKRLTVNYEPATQADRDLVAAAGGVYSVTPDLVNVRPDLRVDGQVVAIGTPLKLGAEDTLRLQLSKGAVAQPETAPVSNRAVGVMAIPLAGPDVDASVLSRHVDGFQDGLARMGQPGFDDDETLGAALYLTGLSYWHERARLGRLVGQTMKIHDIHVRPSPAVVGVESVVYLSGSTVVGIDPGPITVNVHSFGNFYLPATFVPAPPLQALQEMYELMASTGSSLEQIAIETLWRARAVSTVSVLQASRDAGIPVYTITPATRASYVPLLQQSAWTIALVNGSLDAGSTVVIPRQPITIEAWTGTGWKVFLPGGGGGAAYLIQRNLGGGSLAEELERIWDLIFDGVISLEEGFAMIDGLRERIRIPPGEIRSHQSAMRTIPGQPARPHDGVDIRADVGTTVLATSSGVVVLSQSNNSFGNFLVIDHGTDPQGNRLYTLYAHNSVLLVPSGTSVTPATPIARSGATGQYVTGPHIHYEVRVVPPGGPTPSDPSFYRQAGRPNVRDPEDYLWPALTPP